MVVLIDSRLNTKQDLLTSMAVLIDSRLNTKQDLLTSMVVLIQPCCSINPA
jgi:hypothetical protein